MKSPPANLSESLEALWRRLERLRFGEGEASNAFLRWAARFFLNEWTAHLPQLERLRHDLIRTGLTPVAATHLQSDAVAALSEFQMQLGALERAIRGGRAPPGGLSFLVRAFPQLASAVKTVFAPETREICPVSPPIPFTRSANQQIPSARLAVGKFLTQRALSSLTDASAKRRRLNVAREWLLRMDGRTASDSSKVWDLKLQLAAQRTHSKRSERSDLDRQLAELALGLPAARRETLKKTLTAVRALDIGEWEEDSATNVQSALSVETTGEIDPGRWIIEDPRLVLYNLAAGQQRSYAKPKPSLQPKKERHSVRLYVCDASGSMAGTRGEFRDAMLLAELDELRHGDGGPFYFCFFNEFPSELTRVQSPDDALKAMRLLFANSPALGQTDITAALVFAFEQILKSKGSDPYLAQATVVLVTDGEDRPNPDRIRESLARLDGTQVSLSLISLGVDNAHLRLLAEEQRSAGHRAYYQHLDDFELQWLRWGDESALSEHESLGSAAAGKVPLRNQASDILSALIEVAPLFNASERGRQTCEVLHHLLSLFELSAIDFHRLIRSDDMLAAQALRLRRFIPNVI